jgi:hypothetical protein
LIIFNTNTWIPISYREVIEMKQANFIIFLFFAAVSGCEAESHGLGESDGDADGDSDSDSDNDSDSDSDGDTDSDSDGDIDSSECTQGDVWCLGDWVAECDEDGDWVQQTDCSELGLVCAAGECVDISEECADAINEKSYIGCEYFATTLSNSQLLAASFTYAIAIANNGSSQAEIHIDDGPGGVVSNDYVVSAGQMITIEDLPWKEGIRSACTGTFPSAVYATRKVANAVYHVTSTMPVTAYQFNALHYTTGAFFSYTNDASLLLPAHIYRDEYVVMSRPTFKIDVYSDGTSLAYQPGFLAILGSDEGTTVVDIESAAYTLASDSLSNASYSPLSPGGSLTGVEIGPYEVLQILSASEPGCTDATACYTSSCCNTPSTYDLTGTVVRVVSGPNPAVFGGHDCAFVPFNKWACDHLEEQMFPLETWGTHYLCPRNVTQVSGEPTGWRVLSGADANEISFSPSSVHPAVTLDKGEFIEFGNFEDFEIVGEGRVSVAQFMVGQNYTSDTNPPLNGDPAMALAVPVEQYRTSYIFLAPTSYVSNYLTVVHKTGSYPSLDGITIAGDTVEITDEYARTNLQIAGGVHDITSTEPFGIEVYGVGSYTSYMYPGGLDLKEVDVVVQ